MGESEGFPKDKIFCIFDCVSCASMFFVLKNPPCGSPLQIAGLSGFRQDEPNTRTCSILQCDVYIHQKYENVNENEEGMCVSPGHDS